MKEDGLRVRGDVIFMSFLGFSNKIRNQIGNGAKRGLLRGFLKLNNMFSGMSLKLIKIFFVSFLGLGSFFSVCYLASEEDDGETQSYVNNDNSMGNGESVTGKQSDGDKEVVKEYSNGNAACKGYYQVLAENSIWQVSQVDGSLVKYGEEGSSKDYFKRDTNFYLDPDLLYCMNRYVFGDDFVYPEAFTKPVAYNKDTYELIMLTDEDGKVCVESDILDNHGKPTGKRTNSVSDYGLATVCTYTTFNEVTTLEGTYIEEDYYDEVEGKIKKREINEPFCIVTNTESHDILDKVVTYAGSIKYNYTSTHIKQKSLGSGKGESEEEAKRKIYYDSYTADMYVARPTFSSYAPNLYFSTEEAMLNKCESGDYSPVMENGEYKKESKTYKLYKYRDKNSGVYLSGVTPSSAETTDLGNQYLYEYLSNFNTYKPNIERTYDTFNKFSSQTNLKDYSSSAAYGENAQSVTNADVQAFIDEIVPYAQEQMKTAGILPSFTIAQAILESGFPLSELSSEHHNLFGIKAYDGYTGEVVSYKTGEYDENGNYYTTYANFCSWEDYKGCLDYRSRMIWGDRYKNVVGVTDPYEAAYLIASDGWCTLDANLYADRCKSIVDKYNLTQYDNVAWDGKAPDFVEDDSGYDRRLGYVTSSLNDKDKEAFYDFVHAVERVDDDTVYEDYYKFLSYSEIDDMLILTNSYINETTISEENIYSSDALWTENYLTNLMDDDANSSYALYNGAAICNASEITEMDMIYPLPSSCNQMTSHFGYRNPGNGGSTNHQGLDIACSGGTEVYAVADGTVTFAGYNGGSGNQVTISHGTNANGYEVETLYLHNSQLCVSVGDEVKQGQVIAKSGNTGVGGAYHLDIRLRINGVYYNFLRVFGRLDNIRSRDGTTFTVVSQSPYDNLGVATDENYWLGNLYYTDGFKSE